MVQEVDSGRVWGPPAHFQHEHRDAVLRPDKIKYTVNELTMQS